MKAFGEQRVCVKFCFKLVKIFAETFQMLKQVYGEACLDRTQCNESFQRFKSGRTSTEGDPKLDGLPHQWTMVMLEGACSDSPKSLPNCA
jgi:hypothetical protein